MVSASHDQPILLTKPLATTSLGQVVRHTYNRYIASGKSNHLWKSLDPQECSATSRYECIHSSSDIRHTYLSFVMSYLTLQLFTGNYRDSREKSECRDFKFMGVACIPAIPVILKFRTLISIVIFAGNLILQGYYGDSPH